MHFHAVNRYYSRDKQRGVALIMTMLVIVLIIATVLVNYFNPETKRLRMEQRTQESLARAKEAFLAHILTEYDRGNPRLGTFIRLPCPDHGNGSAEGSSYPNCASAAYASAIGRFPWRTFGVEAIRDGSGECLWYAISGHYKTQPNPVPTLTNSDSPGQLLLNTPDGTLLSTTPDSRPVAAIFAPGSPLGGQNRFNDPGAMVCGGNYTISNYLEGVNSNFQNDSYGLDGITQGNAVTEKDFANPINDRVITITKAEIWNAISDRNYPDIDPIIPPVPPATPPPIPMTTVFERFTRQLALCLSSYGLNHPNANDLRLPWAIPVNGVALQDWFYGDDNNYVDQVDKYGGRFPFTVTATADSAGYAAPGGNIFVEGQCDAFLPGDPTFPLYRNLWNHWKDHVFYAVSEARAPNSDNPSQPCGGPNNLCLNVNGYEYAAIVMFAGSPLDTPACNPPVLKQSRDAPPDSDAKALTCNYLEGGNDVILDGEDGDGIYQYQPGNDIMVCICENLDCNPLTPEIDIDTDCDPLTAL